MVIRRRYYGPTATLLVSAMFLCPSATALAKPRNEPAPLFMAFKAFCLDTKAQLTAVQAAVRIAPYKFRERLSGAFAPPLTKEWTKGWEFELEGRRMKLNVGVSKTSDGRRTVRKDRYCTVLSDADESAGMNQAFRWLGIDTTRPIIGDTFRPDILPGVKVLSFYFVWSAQGPKEVQRVALGNPPPPGHWGLALTQAKNYGALSIGRTISLDFKAQ
jgi:hypothetical protein